MYLYVPLYKPSSSCGTPISGNPHLVDVAATFSDMISPWYSDLTPAKAGTETLRCPLFVGLMWAKIHLSPPKHKRNHKKKQLVVYGKYAPVKSHHPLATDLLSRSQIKKFTFFGYPKNMVMLVKLENLVAPWLWNFDPNPITTIPPGWKICGKSAHHWAVSRNHETSDFYRRRGFTKRCPNKWEANCKVSQKSTPSRN